MLRSILPCPRPRMAGVAMLLTIGLLLCGASPPCVAAQPTNEAVFRPANLTTPEQRAELYRTLRKQAEVLEAQSAVVKTVARLLGPTVVHIEAEVSARAMGMYARRRPVEEAGAGVVVQIDGKYYVLTNGHVIRNSTVDQIKINLADGRQIQPEKLWDDPAADVAAMAISAPDLVAAEMGDSDRMDIGDFVLAVGSPFGLSQSVTYGIISAKGRRNLGLGETSTNLRFQNFLQTDAAVNPGNSGGPLVNLRGEVIGINTAIASNSGGSEGIAFAIPSNMFMTIARQLIEQGKVTRAFLGVDLDGSFGPALAAELGLPRPTGARITGIRPGTPAETAKLQTGDVVLEFNEILVEDDAHLINLVSLTEIGKTVSLVVFRDRKPITLTLKLVDRSGFESE